MRFREVILESVDSTNIEVRRAIDAGESEGYVVRAWRQSAGYGRRGRPWMSPEGGLYLSALLRPNVPIEHLPSLSLVAGLAVREALAKLLSTEDAACVQMKWPNDVVLSSEHADAPSGRVRKLAGVLLERYRGAVCLGVGVNILAPQVSVDVGGGNEAAYLSEMRLRCADVDRGVVDGVSDEFLREFGCMYQRWQAEGLQPFIGQLNECLFLVGRQVTVENAAGEITAKGTIARVDAEGRLVLDAAGELRRIVSGEVRVRPA